jgi:hypothetical protein
LEQRGVIVEEVPILDQTGCPTPGHVKMLRLVGVEPVVEVGKGAQNQRDQGQGGEDEAFGSLQTSMSEWRASTRPRCGKTLIPDH